MAHVALFNKKLLILILLIMLAIVGLWFWNEKLNAKILQNSAVALSDRKNIPCKPTFVDGGGPYYHPNAPFRQNFAPEDSVGTKLKVTGRILKNDCKTPVANAILDIWHADPTGSYQNDWYRGKITSSGDGVYSFETVVPKGYGEGTGYRPPHIHFKVFSDGKELITSQMFFSDVRGTFEDAFIMEIKNEGSVQFATHDIILP